MAAWLWVTNLDAKNDWIKLNSFSFGSSAGRSGNSGWNISLKDMHFTLDPGRFRPAIYDWLIRGTLKTAWVFVDPQTEYELLNSMGSSISASGGDKLISLSINFEKLSVSHSGAP